MVKAWKDNELKISKIFGTKRNPYSGSMSHQSQSDTLHENFYIEVKDGKQSLPSRWSRSNMIDFRPGRSFFAPEA